MIRLKIEIDDKTIDTVSENTLKELVESDLLDAYFRLVEKEYLRERKIEEQRDYLRDLLGKKTLKKA